MFKMKRPQERRRSLKPFWRNKPIIIIRILAFLLLLTVWPILIVISPFRQDSVQEIFADTYSDLFNAMIAEYC